MKNLSIRSSCFRSYSKIIFCLILLTILSSCSFKINKNGNPTYLSTMADFYQKNLSGIDFVRKGECPMHPTCSQFAREAVDIHGFFMGGIISSERLMRCGRDCVKKLKIIKTKNNLKFYDPVPLNDKESKNEIF